MAVTVNNTTISFSISRIHLVITGLVLLGLGLGIAATPVLAADNSHNDGLQIGRETGLQLPRFVSLKSRAVNLRVGPGRKYAITWQYKKRGLPVEVIQEFDQWRRIRDSEGSTGWVLHSLLSSQRTAIVAPWQKPEVEFGKPIKAAFFEGKDDANHDASTIARLQAGLMVQVEACRDKWCSVEAQGVPFWLKQDTLWGVYPNENIDD